VRILEVVVRFHPYVGGVENSVYELGRRLVQRGHEVRVVCAAEPDGPAEVEGMAIVRLPWRFKVGNSNLAFGLREALLREFQDRPDVIHTHLPTAWFADMAASVAQERGWSLVLTYHNDLVGEGLKGVLAGVYNRHFLPRVLAASRRIVVTNPLYPAQSPWLDETDPKLAVIPWGVEAEAFRPPEREPAPVSSLSPLRIGFLSLLDAQHRYKGLEVLLDAISRLGGDPPVHLTAGGAGEELGFYRRRAEELGIADRVDFTGFVPAAEIEAFYGGCHVFALPSTDGRREGFGLVLLEAMACGRPVLTTPIVGIAGDVEPRDVGLLVPPGDPAALAGALRRLHDRRADLPEMGRRARRLVEERYTWGRVVDDYERLFQDLQNKGRRP
jgi:glycosyltransferase involved in cell wall biosynthesis